MDDLASSLDHLVADTFLERAEHHSELASTNDRAAELGRDGGPLPALVVAERQTRGRGRGANRWWSAEGSLTFSVVVERDRLDLAPERLPCVALVTGLAVRAAVVESWSSETVAAEPALKWPNDVLMDDRKLAGILVEESGGRIVVGIGLNVNNALADAPEDVRGRATSLADVFGHELNRPALLFAIVQRLAEELERLVEPEPRLVERWSRVCGLTSRPIRVRVHERIVEGICDGIDDTGALVVRTPFGSERILSGVVESFG